MGEWSYLSILKTKNNKAQSRKFTKMFNIYYINIYNFSDLKRRQLKWNLISGLMNNPSSSRLFS